MRARCWQRLRASLTNATSRSDPRSASAAAACCGCVGRRLSARARWRAWPAPGTAVSPAALRRRPCRSRRRTLVGQHRLPRAVDRRARQRVSESKRRRRTSSGCASSRSRPKWHWRRAARATLVLTHSHDLDLRITEAILRRGDFALPRADRLGHQTRALRAPLRGARHRHRRAGAPHLPDRRARHRRQGT